MSKTMLIVDDDDDWRVTLAGLVGDCFPYITIVAAGSADEAKRLLETVRVDLAILDIRLDETDEDNMDGLLLMEYIQAEYQNSVRVIMMTGYAGIHMVTRSLKPSAIGIRPAMDFLEKSELHIKLIPCLQVILVST